MWERRDQTIPEAWYRLPIFYFSNVSELRGPGDPIWAPRGSSELDYELEIGALIDTPAIDLPEERGEEAIGGYVVLNDWSARDLQRDESTLRLGPAKGKDFGVSIGPWLVTPDELADRRSPGGTGPDLAMVATIRTHDGREVETSHGSWSSAYYAFGQMVARASADVRLRPASSSAAGPLAAVPARDPRGDPGPLPGAGGQGHPRDRAVGRLVSPVIARPS